MGEAADDGPAECCEGHGSHPGVGAVEDLRVGWGWDGGARNADVEEGDRGSDVINVS